MVTATSHIRATSPIRQFAAHRARDDDPLRSRAPVAAMDKVVKRLQAREQQAPSFAAAQQPSALLENVELHAYQLRGVRWLLDKYAQELNPILGDEMGLGKTLQVIAFVAALIEHLGDSAKAPVSPLTENAALFLIVAPLSVLPNWMEQFERFAPAIDVLMYAGQKAERTATEDKVVQSKSKVRVCATRTT